MGDFWQNQASWPRDTPEMMFLGRAADALGRSLFGEAWTGEEPGMKKFSFFQIATDKRATNNFLARYLPHFGRKKYDGSMAPPPVGHSEYVQNSSSLQTRFKS